MTSSSLVALCYPAKQNQSISAWLKLDTITMNKKTHIDLVLMELVIVAVTSTSIGRE
jgi:hypothetical protein